MTTPASAPTATATAALMIGQLAPYPHAVPQGREFQERFGPSSSLQDNLINAGEIESVLIGKAGTTRGRRLILVASWLAYLERQKQLEAAGKIGAASNQQTAQMRAAKAAKAAAEAAEREAKAKATAPGVIDRARRKKAGSRAPG
jgi:hypothetical protein